jgi:translation initiation factor 1
MARPQPGPVHLGFRRGGKGSGVTRVEHLLLHPSLKDALLRGLKKRLACGGALREGALELQGDHRDFVEAELRARGYEVRRSGG